MKYLVDVNVMSESTKTLPNPRVQAWMNAHENDLRVDPIIMGEIGTGILAMDEGRRKQNLAAWFEAQCTKHFCLPWTLEAALVWAKLLDDVRKRGFTVGIKDTMIAATARHHGLIVATRNVGDFTRCGVPVINPFEY